MNIYLVERTDDWSYDDYDGYVCRAVDEEQARTMGPDPETYKYRDGAWYFQYYDGSEALEKGGYSAWVKDFSKLEIKNLGVAEDSTPGVILASFNAG